MDQGIDPAKHPDWRAHVANASPHAEHGTHVMIDLQRAGSLALHQDDQGVEDFIELAEVEHPAPKGQAFVPQPADVGRVRTAVSGKLDDLVLYAP